MGKDVACLLHARLKDTLLDSPSNTRYRNQTPTLTSTITSSSQSQIPNRSTIPIAKFIQLYPTIPNFWHSGSFSKVIAQALTIDHPLRRVFALMCMLHSDKPSNLSGPWLTNVAKMIMGIYAAIMRIYAAITWIYAAITRMYAAIFSGKLRKCHALHQFRIFPKVTGNAHVGLIKEDPPLQGQQGQQGLRLDVWEIVTSP